MIRKALIITFQTALILIALSCLAMIALRIAGNVSPIRWEAVDASEEFMIIAVIDGHMALHWDYFANLGDDNLQSYKQRNENVKTNTRRMFPQKRRGFYFKFLPPLLSSPVLQYSHRTREFGFDLWLPILLTATALTWFMIRYSIGPLRRKRRRRLGLCLNCGYDLRSFAEPRCPECAMEFDPSIYPVFTLATGDLIGSPDEIEPAEESKATASNNR